MPVLNDSRIAHMENAATDLNKRIANEYKKAGLPVPKPGVENDDAAYAQPSISVLLATLYTCRLALEHIGGLDFMRKQMTVVTLQDMLDPELRDGVLRGEVEVEYNIKMPNGIKGAPPKTYYQRRRRR